jgi:small conductance mechanosensitive channel
VVSKRIITAVDDQDDSTLTDKEKRGRTLAQVVRSFGRVMIYSIAVLLTLNIFIEIGPLLAGAGVAGLAISFGAQSLVKDVITGFFFLMEDQFTVGDVVGIAGHTGTVERMTLRVVAVRDLDGVLHIVPNGQITTVSNKTRGWSQALVEVGVSYGADLDGALEVFRDEARLLEQDREWGRDMDGSPEVMGVQELGNDSVIIRTLLRTIPGRQWQVAREFRRRIKNRLDREGIEIPFPQRTVHLRQLGPTA